MYAMEFVADKIPYVDSTWDAISTLIRPTAGAVIGALLAGDVPRTSLDQVVLASVGGGTALASHLVKAGIRLAVNTSPEPVTNIGVSVLEDVAVLGLVAFAIQHPRAAAAVAGVLLAIGLVAAVLHRPAGPPRLAALEGRRRARPPGPPRETCSTTRGPRRRSPPGSASSGPAARWSSARWCSPAPRRSSVAPRPRLPGARAWRPSRGAGPVPADGSCEVVEARAAGRPRR